MSDADELAKLAELRDKGIISKREFNRKKTAILQGKSGTRGLWWKLPLRVTLTVVVIGILIIGGGRLIFEINEERAEGGLASVDTPTCDSGQAQKDVAAAVADNVASHLINLKLLDIKNTKQLSYDPSTHERLCSATAYFNSGEKPLSFRFFNLDPQKGAYLVEVK